MRKRTSLNFTLQNWFIKKVGRWKNPGSFLSISCCSLHWTAGYLGDTRRVKRERWLTATTEIVDLYGIDGSLQGGENSGAGLRAESLLSLLNTALSLVCQFKRGIWLTLFNIQKFPENRLVFTLKALQPLPILKLKDLFLERTIIIQYNLPLFRMRSEHFSDKMLHLSGSLHLISFWSPNFPYLA